MINFSELKVGDIVIAKYEEQMLEGRILQIDHDNRQVCVLTQGEQESWYTAEELFPIPLTAEQLVKLKFKKTDEAPINGNGEAWVRGPFTVLLSNNHIVLHYRDETRDIPNNIMVHQLQNHYHGMTLYHLD